MASPEQSRLTPTSQDTRRNHADLPSLAMLLRMTFEKWYNDNIPRHAAALAFYTLFAVAPLLLLATEIMGMIYGHEAAEAQLVAQVERYIHSSETSALVQTILDNALPTSSPWWFTVGVIIALIYGASSVFGELQIVLNLIWGAPLTLRDDIWGLIWGRLLAVLMVILSGLLLFFALFVATWSDTANNWAASRLTTGSYGEWSYALVLFLLMTVVFSLIYKFVPHVAIAWHDVLIGAVATAFLISVARLLITFYLSHSRVGPMFGTAGSLVILLLWAYYSAQIFFLGAEFTYVYGRTYGARRRLATLDALPIPPTAAPPMVTAAHQPISSAPMEPPPPANDTPEDELITDEITALQPLALEPAEPVAVSVSNEQPNRKARGLRLPKPPPVHQRIQQVQRRLAQLWVLPRTIARPVREILVAVGVIGALSLAALFGLPWRKRRPANSEALEQDSSGS
ncbi:MAG: YihY/virulence factor BrkB family protein [Caldilineaceae bacterium]|nr:YihY/virulence factor BrkB family protein [Caldilineaceae bacterium]